MTTQQAALPDAHVRVNDVHAQLNETAVADVIPIDSVQAVRQALMRSRAEELPVAVSGGRHAMGGQQFCSGGLLLDTRPMNRVRDFDRERGVIDVEAGIQWPTLISYLSVAQSRAAPAWGIRQKQSGADRLCLGGSLAANVHGRGLTFPPIVDDVESLTLIDGAGEAHECSRQQNAELFALAIGGYGLFGVVSSVRLRLTERRLLERVVEVIEIGQLIGAFDARLAGGFRYGDFQFAIDPAGPGFLRQGVFSCYRPVDEGGTVNEPPDGQRRLAPADWRRLIHLAHVDKSRAFDLYAEHYLATSGQLYNSDAHQLSDYVDDYHQGIDQLSGAPNAGSEMITELFVPRHRLVDFMAEAAEQLRRGETQVVYGTIRLIERDTDSFLAWAREPWACVIVNLHTDHTAAGLQRAALAFQGLIDAALALRGSYYLTYHRWARPDQVEAAHPRFVDFLAAKRRYDPDKRFQSDWYRHYTRVFG